MDLWRDRVGFAVFGAGFALLVSGAVEWCAPESSPAPAPAIASPHTRDTIDDDAK